MNLRQLAHLTALAEQGSFSRAAERLHLTQSALSRSLQTLEDELGARLIDRAGKRSTLTPLGEAVLARARRITLEAAEIQRSAELLRQGEAGTIRVGLGSGPGALLMTPLLTLLFIAIFVLLTLAVSGLGHVLNYFRNALTHHARRGGRDRVARLLVCCDYPAAALAHYLAQGDERSARACGCVFGRGWRAFGATRAWANGEFSGGGKSGFGCRGQYQYQ